MRQPGRIAWGALVVGLLVAACGGASKPPMVPDAPDPAIGADGGADTPTAPAPAKK